MTAMAAVVAAEGYAATSVADVLHAATMSRTTFYELFTDKLDCFLATYDNALALTGDAIAQARVGVAASWREQAERTLRALLDTFAAHPDFAHVCMVDALGAGPAAIERYRRSTSTFCTLIERDAAADPEHPAVPRVVIEVLVGGLTSLMRTRIADGRVAELPGLLPELTDVYVGTLLGYDENRRRDGRPD